MLAQMYTTLIDDDATMRSYARTILEKGYVLCPQFLDPTFLEEVRTFGALARQGVVESSKSDDTTPMMRLARSAEFMKLFNQIYRFRCEAEGVPYAPLDPARQHVGLPYKDATGGAKTKQTEFHYDGAFVNCTIGVIEPPKGQGELHMFPNFRKKFRSSLASKIASRMLRHVKVFRSWYGYVTVPVEENTACLFFGDRSFHGVEPITSGRRMIITINNHW